MATDRDVVEALRRAAEALIGRRISQAELDDLIDRFNRAEGTYRDRAIKALKGFTTLSEAEIGHRKAASDNVDRIMGDLRDKLDDWKPSKQ